jgi:hypothetical protein
MIESIGISLQLQSIMSIMTAHNQWLLTNRSIPNWTMSVFSSAWLTWFWFFSFRCPLVNTPQLNTELSYDWITTLLRIPNEESLVTESESYVTTDGQPASLSWNKAPMWCLRPDFYYCLTVVRLLIWVALSDERTGLSFTIASGSRQCSHSCVRVPWDSRPYFTVSDSRLPFLSPPTIRRATVEVFDPASTREILLRMNCDFYNFQVPRI